MKKMTFSVMTQQFPIKEYSPMNVTVKQINSKITLKVVLQKDV